MLSPENVQDLLGEDPELLEIEEASNTCRGQGNCRGYSYCKGHANLVGRLSKYLTL